MLNKIIISFILIIQLYFSFTDEFPQAYNPFFLKLILTLDLVALFSYLILNKNENFNLKSNKLKFTSLFLIGFTIVCYQPFIDLALGYLDEENYNLFIQPSNILRTFLYSSIAVNSFLFGLTLFKSKAKIPKSIGVISTKTVHLKSLKILNVIFFMLFLSQINSSFLDASNYGSESSTSPLRTYAMLLYETSFMALIIHIILNTGHRSSFYGYLKQFGYNIFFLGLYLLLILISGDRGPIIYLSLAFLFGYLYLNDVKIKSIKIIIFAAIFSILLGAIATFRRSGDANDLTNNLLIESRYYPSSVSPLTKELATSVLTVSTAVYNIPDNYSHFYGLFMLQNFTLLVPGLNSFGNAQFGVERIYFSSPKFLTYVALGPDATWGVGTSAVADVYLDFGIIGIVIIFVLFGYFIKRLEVNVMGYKTKKFFPVALYLLYFSFSIYISRSNLVVPFTKFAYVAIFYFITIKSKKN